MKVSDLLVGALFIIAGLGLVAYGASLPPMTGQRYGAGLFPMALGVCATLAGGALAWTGAKARRQSHEPLAATAPWARDPRLAGNFVFVLALIVVYVLASEHIGFIPLSIVMLTALFRRLDVPLGRGLLIALVATGTLHVLFSRVLRVPLPRGLLEGLIW